MDAKMTQTSNPLRQFFRQPAIYVRLPSQGQHWAPDSLDMPDNSELPVYPMTAIDEISYRTPDALFNGQAVVNVIQSCIPNIKNAWAMPSIDLDTVLVAIRIASYGHAMGISTVCPNCSHEGDYNVDLRKVLDQMRQADYSKPVARNGLEIHFRPLNYRQVTDNSVKQFEQQKTVNVLPDSNLSEEEKIKTLQGAIDQLTELTVITLAQCINVIKTGSAIVTEPEFILEFLRNCDSATYNQIKDHVTALREQSDIKPLSVVCDNCKNQYQQPFGLDQANFFGLAS